MGCSSPGSSVHGFSKQEYWSGLPFPSPGDLLQGSNPGLLHCRQILYHLSHQGSHKYPTHSLEKAVIYWYWIFCFHSPYNPGTVLIYSKCPQNLMLNWTNLNSVKVKADYVEEYCRLFAVWRCSTCEEIILKVAVLTMVSQEMILNGSKSILMWNTV